MSSSTTAAAQPSQVTDPPPPKTSTTSFPDLTNIKSSQPSTYAYPLVEVGTGITYSIIYVLIDVLVLHWIVLLGVMMAILTVVAILQLFCGSHFRVSETLKSIFFSTIRLLGNSILRATHHAHYTSNAFAAYIGVTYNEQKEENVPWYFRICASLLFSTLSGTVGCAILLHNHVDLGGIDVLHATRAGALGGAILAPGLIFVVPLVSSLTFKFIFWPLWIAISSGTQWLWRGLSESWTNKGYSAWRSFLTSIAISGTLPMIETYGHIVTNTATALLAWLGFGTGKPGPSTWKESTQTAAAPRVAFQWFELVPENSTEVIINVLLSQHNGG
ncbi:hypothetical protein BYT27DRAFT_7260495 [Phlegmacium glaucopus]|nr:hypothetical protein BYT27DRAFT_7260495 [Phlegmacium glaucopus]